MTTLPRPDSKERLLCFNTDLQQYNIGDLFKQDYGHSQFCGSWTFRVTRISGNEVYGVYVTGDVCELDIEDVM